MNLSAIVGVAHSFLPFSNVTSTTDVSLYDSMDPLIHDALIEIMWLAVLSTVAVLLAQQDGVTKSLKAFESLNFADIFSAIHRVLTTTHTISSLSHMLNVSHTFSILSRLLDRQRSPRQYNHSLHKRTIFLRDISYSTTESDVSWFISRVAKPEDVLVCKFPDTGRARGFAFVQMETRQAMERAIQDLHNTRLHGRYVKLEPSATAISRARC